MQSELSEITFLDGLCVLEIAIIYRVFDNKSQTSTQGFVGGNKHLGCLNVSSNSL